MGSSESSNESSNASTRSWSLSKRSVSLATRAAQLYSQAPDAEGSVRKCTGAGVLSTGSKAMVRRELASSGLSSEGELLLSLFMVLSQKGKKRKETEQKKNVVNRRCETLILLN